MYPGTKPGCFDHTRVGTWVPNLVVLIIFGYVPGYQMWLFMSKSGMYLGIKVGCFGHTRVGTWVPNLAVLVILGYVPGDLQSMCLCRPLQYIDTQATTPSQKTSHLGIKHVP